MNKKGRASTGGLVHRAHMRTIKFNITGHSLGAALRYCEYEAKAMHTTMLTLVYACLCGLGEHISVYLSLLRNLLTGSTKHERNETERNRGQKLIEAK